MIQVGAQPRETLYTPYSMARSGVGKGVSYQVVTISFLGERVILPYG
jgi:hypothetical protein